MPQPQPAIDPIHASAWFDMLLLNDCEPDEKLDVITTDAAKVFKVPIAMINLVTADEIIFKACIGEVQGNKIERSGAFCSLAVNSEKPLMIPDATLDPRFKNFFMVSGPLSVRAYLGKALHAPDGSIIGTFCLFDTKPRRFTAKELDLLDDFVELAEDQLSTIFSSL